jgi:hypothetical protein
MSYGQVAQRLEGNGQHLAGTDNTWPFPLPLNIGTVDLGSMGRGWGMTERVIR